MPRLTMSARGLATSTPGGEGVAPAEPAPDRRARLGAGGALQRSADMIASGLGLLVVAPLLLAVCGLIWVEDRHNPLYVAPRVGRFGRPFRMVKLRSMRVRADRTGVDSTAKHDPRITRVGAAVRRLKLDELPQLWNVLRGDMSLVGPRP